MMKWAGIGNHTINTDNVLAKDNVLSVEHAPFSDTLIIHMVGSDPIELTFTGPNTASMQREMFLVQAAGDNEDKLGARLVEIANEWKSLVEPEIMGKEPTDE